METEWKAMLIGILFDASVRSVVVAAGVAAILFTARMRSSTVRHGAWSGVMIAMLLMPLLAWLAPPVAVPFLPSRIAVPVPASVRPERTVKPFAPNAGKAALQSPAGGEAETARRAPPRVSTPSGEPSPKPDARLPWPALALALYGAGVAALLVRWCLGWLSLRRVIRSSRNVSLPNGGIVLESDVVFSPVTCGVLRPRVILPADWRKWPEGKLHAVIAHERAHIVRRDPLAAFLAGINRTVFWFHPLAWLLERRISILAEHACDDAAVAETGGAETYAAVLIEIADTVRRRGGRHAWSGLGVHGKGALRRRIERVLGGVRAQGVSVRRKAVVALLCVAAVYLSAAGQPRKQQKPPDLATPDIARAVAMLHSSDKAIRDDAYTEFLRLCYLEDKGFYVIDKESVSEKKSAVIRVLSGILDEPNVSSPTWYAAANVLMNFPENAEAVRALVRHIDYGDGRAGVPNDNAFMIARVLGNMDKPPLDDLIAALSSGSVTMRERAAYALGESRSEQVEQALRRARAREPEKSVVGFMDAAIRKIEYLEGVRWETFESAAVVRHCLAQDSGFISKPINTIFLDGKTTTVNETLCLVDLKRGGPGDKGEWWHLKTTPTGVESIIFESKVFEYSIAEIAPSPDGKYLAIRSAAEGAPFIAVVELPALVRERKMEPVGFLAVGLGPFSLQGWNGDALLVASNSRFIGLLDSRLELLPESGEQVFSWNVRTDTVIPLSAALRDPGRYYCGGLGAANSYSRSTSAAALRLLDDRSAMPCIEAALARTPNDEELKSTLRYLRTQHSAATSSGKHLTVSEEGSERRLFFFYDRGDFLEEASIAFPTDIAMESIDHGLKNVLWDGAGTNAAVAFERTSGVAFVVAFVAGKDLTYAASDISRLEGANLGGIGPFRTYPKRKTQPVKWQGWSDGRRSLVVLTEAWDESGKRYAMQSFLYFDDSGQPVYK